MKRNEKKPATHRRSFVMLFSMATALLFTMLFTMNVNADQITVTSESELLSAISSASGSEASPDVINLGQDIEVNQEFILSSGQHIEILGNGYTMAMASDNTATTDDPTISLFFISGGASLSLSNITIDGQNQTRLFYVTENASFTSDESVILTRGKAAATDDKTLGGQCIYNAGTTSFAGTITTSLNGYYGVIYNSGTFTLEDSASFSSVRTTKGGAIYNDTDGTFVMEGGTFQKALGVSSYGVAITNFGTFTMENGTITESSGSVSTIYNAGTFTMEGGTISGNTNTATTIVGQSGGTVYQKSGTFTMTGGQISDNETRTGGGVLIDGGSFIMDGTGAEITDNTAIYPISSSTNIADFGNGGGVFINNGSFYLKNGTISGNSAEYANDSEKDIKFNGNGGAIFVNGGTLSISGGTVENNEAIGENTEGIYVGTNSVGSSSKDTVSFCLSGSASIRDTIYLSTDTWITIDGALGDSVSYPLWQEYVQVGNAIAKYAALESGESEFMQDGDADKFTSVNSESATFELDTDNRQIINAKLDLSTCTITLDAEEYAYTGRAITPDITITDAEGNVIQAYEMSISNNVNVGTATIVLSGDGYTTKGEVTLTFEIVARELTTDNVSISDTCYIYTGSEITPSVAIKIGNVTLSQASEQAADGSWDGDYTVEYANNVQIGTGVITITGYGNVTGTVEVSFYIRLEQTLSGSTSYSKTCGSSFTLDMSVTKGDGSLSYSSSDASIASVNSGGKVTLKKVGTATITVTASLTNQYAPTSKTVKITVTKGTQTLSGSTVYNKTYGSTAFTLNTKVSKGDGTLTYKSANTSIVKVSSSGKVTITGTGRTTITVSAKATSNYYASASRTITITVQPKKASLKSVKNTKAKTATVQWKKDTKATGYQIQYATNKKCTKNVKYILIKKNTTTSTKIKGLKKGKTYYIRIRSYKNVSGKALCGEWSTVKKIKITK
ncbi:MAG: fibronectin type III domain-containing protein [Clostridiales bacterium]|nr:fibronectin type III domain-containing protein [Clostridiales bacterium]